jgi:hypothetical protein
VNATDKPLRSAAGAPSPGAWGNTGSGVLAQLTAHPPTGRFEEHESLVRAGAACVMAAATMRGLRGLLLLVDGVANSPYSRLDPSALGDLQAIGDDIRLSRVSYAQLVQLQTLLARAANLTDSIGDIVKLAMRPPGSSALTREEIGLIKLYERLAVQGRALDATQIQTLVTLLARALGRPVSLMRAWDPLAMTPKRTLRGTCLPPGATTEPHGREDEVVVLGRMSGMLKKQERLKRPKPGMPFRVVQHLLATLEASEAAILRVHASEDKATETDRMIALGRRKDGLTWLYNPDPRHGDATLIFGRAGKNQAPEFSSQIQRYNARLGPDVDGMEPVITILRTRISA